MVMQNNRERFLSTCSAEKLLEKHRLHEKGLWRIQGEDPNCDFGGHHYMPDLGTFEGTLNDVIDYAVELRAFWTWGAGGKITKVSVQKVDPHTAKYRAALKTELHQLKARLVQIEKELGE